MNHISKSAKVGRASSLSARPALAVALWIAFLISTIPARADFAVRWTFADFTQQPQSVKRIEVTPLLEYTVDSTNIITGDIKSRTVNAAGSVIISNMLAGSYRVKFFGSTVLTTFTNSFTNGITGLVNASDYLTISTNLPGNLYAYSQNQSDGRFIRNPASKNVDDVLTWDGTNWIAAAASGGSATNAIGTLDGKGTNTFLLSPQLNWAGGWQQFTNSAGDIVFTNTASGTALLLHSDGSIESLSSSGQSSEFATGIIVTNAGSGQSVILSTNGDVVIRNTFYGNGSGLTNVPGGSVTGAVANASVASEAQSVTVGGLSSYLGNVGGTFVGVFNGSGNGVGLTNLPAFKSVFLSTSGNDTTLGLISSPVASLQRAIDLLTNSDSGGSIIVRGGIYTNQTAIVSNLHARIEIKSYENETVEFELGTNIYAASWSLLSNGIYTATAPADATYLANVVFPFTAGGNRYAYERGTTYGNLDGLVNTNRIFGGLYGNFTNRLPDFPISWTNNIQMLTNGTWTVSNNLVYLVFSDGGAPAGRTITFASSNRVWLSGVNRSLDVSVEGIRIRFPYIGIDGSGWGNVSLTGNYIEGAAVYGIVSTQPARHWEIVQNEVAACSGFGMSLNDDASINGATNAQHAFITTVDQLNNYWHDNGREGSSVRGNVRRFVYGDTAAFNPWHWIQDGNSFGKFHGVRGVASDFASIQCGGPSNSITYRTIETVDCQFIADKNGSILMEGPNNYVYTSGDYFDPASTASPIGFTASTAADQATCRIDIGKTPTVANNNFSAGFKTLIGGSTISNVFFKPFIPIANPFIAAKVMVSSNGIDFIGNTAKLYREATPFYSIDSEFNSGIGDVATFSFGASTHAFISGHSSSAVNTEQYPIIVAKSGTISGSGTYETVIGGFGNTISSSGGSANSIFSGVANTINSGDKSTIIGGQSITVSHSGVTAFSDPIGATFASGSANQLIARFQNGFGFGTSTTKTVGQTNGLLATALPIYGLTNAISTWPTNAPTAGGFAIVNSNATVYILTSTANSQTWAATNKLAGP